MKYEKGDKFIIEIESILDEQVGLYKVRGFRTLVFDDYGLNMLKQYHEHYKCNGCKYEDVSSVEYPCSSCSNAYYCKWEPKPGEIQVGDEVEHDDGSKAVVYEVTDTSICGMYRVNDTIIRCYWLRKFCHRTGKTCPELIKALESLPKE